MPSFLNYGGIMTNKEKKEQTVQEIVKAITGNEAITPDLIDEIIYHLATERKKIEVRIAQRKKEEEERIQEEQKKKEEERISSIIDMELPLDYENIFADTVDVERKVESSTDGLVLSLSNMGRVDIEYIAAICDKDPKDVINDLKGVIYQNPDTWEECFYKGWETSDEYLSGNLISKRRKAEECNKKFRGMFELNIKAIDSVMPQRLSHQNVFITLGSPWVPVNIISEFVLHILGYKGRRVERPDIAHDVTSGTWEIRNKPLFTYNIRANAVYGTRRMDAIHILERTLNMKTITISDEVPCKTSKSGYKRVINQDETALVVEKQNKLIAEFKAWVWSDYDRKERLIDIFEERYGCYKTRRYDGSFLTFPGLNPSVSIYPYQRNAIARILYGKNTLLAHDVGSGKTYIMVCAGMELRRMGLSKKNLYAVPNNIVGQWKKMFAELYPSSSVLTIEPKDFTPTKRKDALKNIKNGDYDAIIIAHSCFDMISVSASYHEKELKERKAVLEDIRKDITKSHAGIKRELQKVENELAKIQLAMLLVDDEYAFDNLGIDRLFVDEAHYYKNVPVPTKMDKVLGVSSQGSKKCEEMVDKVHHVQRSGGGVIMATGTPITNSVSDVFVFQQYLQSGELALLDINCFDAWVGMFAERSTQFEIDVDTSSYRLATRLARFHNLPELTALLSSVSDFHKAESEKGIPEFNGYKDCLIAKTPAFAQYLKEISRRADDVRNHRVTRAQDNMLKITGDGRRAALDIRLVDGIQPFTYQSKVAKCAETVAEIYDKTEDKGLTQLVFIDSSTPKQGFNIYDELVRILQIFGVDRNKVAYIHDADTDKKRDELFKKVRAGDIRILIGSTFKLGVGVNVQDKLIALHHLDVPWRPADMVQREGRLIRPGNENKEVFIFRYITEGSFDAYSWQLLETKQRFISELLSGTLEERSGDEIDDTVLSYAEVKALAIGNPLIKERVEVANEISRLSIVQRKNQETRELMLSSIAALPEKIEQLKVRFNNATYDYEYSQNHPYVAEKEERYALRDSIFEALKDNVFKLEKRVICQYRGFNVVLPENMFKEKPYLLLENSGSYIVEMGFSEKGVLLRLDNFIDDMPKLIENLSKNIDEETSQLNRAKEEVGKTESYSDRIAELKARLEVIDKKLKVK